MNTSQAAALCGLVGYAKGLVHRWRPIIDDESGLDGGDTVDVFVDVIAGLEALVQRIDVGALTTHRNDEYPPGLDGERISKSASLRLGDQDGRSEIAPNRIILTIEGGIVQAVNADRPQEILVTVLDMDVETEDHPSIYRVKDANGIETLVGVGLPVADPIGPGLEGVLLRIDAVDEPPQSDGPPYTDVVDDQDGRSEISRDLRLTPDEGPRGRDADDESRYRLSQAQRLKR